MNKMIIYKLQHWKKLIDNATSDKQILELSNIFFKTEVPVILRQLIANQRKSDGTQS